MCVSDLIFVRVRCMRWTLRGGVCQVFVVSVCVFPSIRHDPDAPATLRAATLSGYSLLVRQVPASPASPASPAGGHEG